MIDFFFGKPRTGKSYRAVKVIYDEYIVNKTPPKFKNIITNIGGFKFDEINEHFEIKDPDNPSKAYKLVWKDFYEHLTKLYSMATDEKSDDDLNRYATYHNINDCLIIIDEASLYLKRYDDVISWYLAYHGHFKHRVIIIAQSPKQIYAEYMSHTEIYYEAQPQSKQLLSNQLRYIHYSDLPFSKDNKFASDSLKTNQEIYNLYKSGEVDKPKKIIYKFIAIFLLALVFVIYSFSSLFHKYDTPSDETQQEQEELYNNDNNFTKSKYHKFKSKINTSLIIFRCDNKNCWISDERYKDYTISKSYLKFVLLENDIELKYFEVKNEIYKLIPQKMGMQKITLASFTDYYYLIPDEIKDRYFSQMFILKDPETKKPNLEFNNSFLNTSQKGKTK